AGPDGGVTDAMVGAPAHGLLMVRNTRPIGVWLWASRTRICSGVPARTWSVEGPGNWLGTWLQPESAQSSSVRSSWSCESDEPVNTASTVSKVLPTVSMNDFVEVASNVQGAVHVHHRLALPAPS